MRITKAIGWDEKAAQFVALNEEGGMVTIPGAVLHDMVKSVMLGGQPLSLDKQDGIFIADGFMVANLGHSLMFSFRLPDGTSGTFKVGTAQTVEKVKAAAEQIQATIAGLMKSA